MSVLMCQIVLMMKHQRLTGDLPIFTDKFPSSILIFNVTPIPLWYVKSPFYAGKSPTFIINLLVLGWKSGNEIQ